MHKWIMRCPGSIDYDAPARCGPVTPYGDTDPGQHWLKYGLLPDGPQASPETMFTPNYRGSVIFTNFTGSAQAIILYNKVEKYTFKITATSLPPRGQWVNPSSMLQQGLWCKISTEDKWQPLWNIHEASNLKWLSLITRIRR